GMRLQPRDGAAARDIQNAYVARLFFRLRGGTGCSAAPRDCDNVPFSGTRCVSVTTFLKVNRTQQLRPVQAPEPHRALFHQQQYLLPTRAEAGVVDLVWLIDCCKQRSSFRVPELGRPIIAGGNDPVAICGESAGDYRIGMPNERHCRRATVSAPELRGG